MDSQQQSVYNFSQQMNSIKQAPSSSHQNPAVTGVVSTPIYKEPHILDREPHIHLATPFEKMEMLCETLVDFDNMKRNGIDLTDELKKQGWENYFQRLYGPVYPNLVKEFERFSDSGDHYIVSYILGVKIVTTEKSIAALLNMEKTGGRRIYNINPRAKYLSHEINPTIFQQNAESKHSKNKELHKNLRVWLKIILGTIHHRPASNSSDYINTDQKCILYYIHKGMKLRLPALLFKYLRDSMKDTRNNMKTRNYIPLGRLISDVLIESGLVDHLIHLTLMEDVMIDTGRPLNARNLKSMGIINQVRVKPTLDTSWEALKDQREIPNGLYLFSKTDPPEVVAYYLEDLHKQGVDISDFSLDWFPEFPPDFQKRTREPSEKTKQAKRAKLGEPSGSRPSVPLVESPEPTNSGSQPSEPPHSDIPQHTAFADPTTPTLNLSPPTSPSQVSELETTLLTLEEAITVFAESSVDKVKSLTINSGISDDPSGIRTHWNRVISWITSEAFKLKGLSEQVRNDFIRDAKIRLQEHLAREAEERERQEDEEKARQEEFQRIKEAEAKALADVAAEAEAKAKAAAEEAARLAEESAANTRNDALTQGEASTFVPLVLKTLEELQKEQQVVRARLDQQDSVNVNIQNMLSQLL
ncbi:hypothetical protein KIW84_064542 [Lathyrus oleraceus]|uniref:Putative plant transposon protein domain-containing protein n=1 Tax=Pisum sativum TaxID=3888 RepID=A0A9D4WCU2_PEA|nr:hypothetical protein KIW84_064542 [Pisum sativum]